MVSIFISWDKKRGKYQKDTMILSMGQWSKIDSNQFCSTIPGTKVREILSHVRKKHFFVVSPPKIGFWKWSFIFLKFRLLLGKVTYNFHLADSIVFEMSGGLSRIWKCENSFFYLLSGDTKKRFRLVGWSMLHCTNAKKTSRVPEPLRYARSFLLWCYSGLTIGKDY